MMEIPAGRFCASVVDASLDCPFYVFSADEPAGPSGCYNPKLMTDDVFKNRRTKECLSAYPNGATIEIAAKEKG